jgi:hypothetical protein
MRQREAESGPMEKGEERRKTGKNERHFSQPEEVQWNLQSLFFSHQHITHLFHWSD